MFRLRLAHSTGGVGDQAPIKRKLNQMQYFADDLLERSRIRQKWTLRPGKQMMRNNRRIPPSPSSRTGNFKGWRPTWQASRPRPATHTVAGFATQQTLTTDGPFAETRGAARRVLIWSRPRISKRPRSQSAGAVNPCSYGVTLEKDPASAIEGAADLGLINWISAWFHDISRNRKKYSANENGAGRWPP